MQYTLKPQETQWNRIEQNTMEWNINAWAMQGPMHFVTGIFCSPVFMHSAAKKVECPANRDLLKVAWFNKMSVQAPEL